MVNITYITYNSTVHVVYVLIKQPLLFGGITVVLDV